MNRTLLLALSGLAILAVNLVFLRLYAFAGLVGLGALLVLFGWRIWWIRVPVAIIALLGLLMVVLSVSCALNPSGCL